jgi:hypothetical protein
MDQADPTPEDVAVLLGEIGYSTDRVAATSATSTSVPSWPRAHWLDRAEQRSLPS